MLLAAGFVPSFVSLWGLKSRAGVRAGQGRGVRRSEHKGDRGRRGDGRGVGATVAQHAHATPVVHPQPAALAAIAYASKPIPRAALDQLAPPMGTLLAPFARQ
jgi:hypothetical protein